MSIRSKKETLKAERGFLKQVLNAKIIRFFGLFQILIEVRVRINVAPSKKNIARR